MVAFEETQNGVWSSDMAIWNGNNKLIPTTIFFFVLSGSLIFHL